MAALNITNRRLAIGLVLIIYVANSVRNAQASHWFYYSVLFVGFVVAGIIIVRRAKEPRNKGRFWMGLMAAGCLITLGVLFYSLLRQ